MTKFMLLLIALFLAIPFGLAVAQQALQGNPGLIGPPRAVPGNQGLIGIPPRQSLSPARSPCSAGSQSVRICNDDFQSCNSACTALPAPELGSPEEA